MPEPYLSEIRLMSFSFPPRGWALCNGQLLSINQYQALFALLGITYGGDGRTNFALPDLRGMVPIHAGVAFSLGQHGGKTAETLSVAQMPPHLHPVNATTNSASTNIPGPSVMLAASSGSNAYQPPANLLPMFPAADGTTGGGQPHENMQPYLTLSFCIATQGIFPSPN